jgi:hypothetical protein
VTHAPSGGRGGSAVSRLIVRLFTQDEGPRSPQQYISRRQAGRTELPSYNIELPTVTVSVTSYSGRGMLERANFPGTRNNERSDMLPLGPLLGKCRTPAISITLNREVIWYNTQVSVSPPSARVHTTQITEQHAVLIHALNATHVDF